MNILIIMLLVIVALIALVLIAALFVKIEYSVRKKVLIDKPLAGVFEYVRQL